MQPSDSLKLPFAIAKEKRLSDDDLKDKKEGVYLTGEPDLSSDPEHGFGAGAEAARNTEQSDCTQTIKEIQT